MHQMRQNRYSHASDTAAEKVYLMNSMDNRWSQKEADCSGIFLPDMHAVLCIDVLQQQVREGAADVARALMHWYLEQRDAAVLDAAAAVRQLTALRALAALACADADLCLQPSSDPACAVVALAPYIKVWV
eukprot:360874-Chlamydomonas_euryale.AAC.11